MRVQILDDDEGGRLGMLGGVVGSGKLVLEDTSVDGNTTGRKERKKDPRDSSRNLVFLRIRFCLDQGIERSHHQVVCSGHQY